jgi:hypothetical protein
LNIIIRSQEKPFIYFFLLFSFLKCLGILRYNPDVEDPIMLIQACELSSFGFFQRGSVREMITFFNKTIAKRTAPGQRQSVQNEGNAIIKFNKQIYIFKKMLISIFL